MALPQATAARAGRTEGLRCFVRESSPATFQAVSIDLGLATGGGSESEAKDSLRSQILSYVMEAHTLDRAYFHDHMQRKATNWIRLESWLIRLRLRRRGAVWLEYVPMPAGGSAAAGVCGAAGGTTGNPWRK